MGKNSDNYAADLERLQILLVEAQHWTIDQGRRTVIVFEGRDSAGKDGAIKRITEYASPRQTRVVALPRPTERETSQWYFQRYVPHLPADGETVLFNRSWYNRAGVEPVMGFCKPAQHAQFLSDAPLFERMLTDDGVVLVKLWLDITKAEQARRLVERTGDPLKRFKVSPLDAEAQARWDDYSKARDRMLDETDHVHAPWTVVATDDKKTARLNIIRHILRSIGGPGAAAEAPDEDVVFLASKSKGRLAA
ncbi:MAG: polyphosphate kinase 2 [Brevundimonas sp.]|uniref:polyphosphate kinase 2 n=1 Tax=Brevundimonas sp. TaxID=1871086 RepID=UPI00276489E9|nr:polyphosphate kinase 2 [Brevundimonas sp.]MDP3370646.1 polyphosphate kinase 2 [Brevundimonas sp.]MDZ4110241.1 polyphosphate kinase 2 [Brevundimonas sp.]